jgi:uncharacterized membrane protein YhhN
MNSKRKIALLIFAAVSVIHVLGILLKHDPLQLFTKPLLIPALIVLYKLSVEKVNKWYIIALVFSFLGDVFLLDKGGYFIYGIASFLLTQLIYIRIVLGKLKPSKLIQKVIAIIPFSVFFIVLIGLLKDNLDALFYPVIIYGIAISVFGMVSLLKYLTDKSTGSLYLLLGATIFISSDSMIALHQFYEPKPFYGLFIMITYIVAQYLIYRFMILEKKPA